MLHPVGRLPARVYWRRRLVFVGVPLLAIVLLLWALLSGGADHPSARTASSTTTKPASSAAPATSAQPRDSGSIGVSATTPASSTPATSASSAPSGSDPSTAAKGKGFCAGANLDITAGTAKASFAVKSNPGLAMLVRNTSGSSCKLDVADKHVEWRVYSGDVRVWGSHDCALQAGSDVVTLSAHQAIRLDVTWSGLTSAPKCSATRMAVQVGTYTLYAYLDGKRSSAKTFTIK